MESLKSPGGNSPLIQQLRQGMSTYRPRLLPIPPLLPRAAVLMPITKTGEPQLILTVRTQSMPTHAGEVAFPGGRHEKGEDIQQTAFREAREEVNIHSDDVELLGSLTSVASKHGIKVTPFVGLVSDSVELAGDPGEIDEIFHVPLRFFLEQKPELTAPFNFFGKRWHIPNYYFDGKRIWGLTAFMIIDLMNSVFDANISLK